ncbi:MAG TPA: NlpC/P60 family protein [Chthoniobacteraceae bacterium]
MRKKLILPVLAMLALAAGLEIREVRGASVKSSDSSDDSAATPKPRRHHRVSSQDVGNASATPKTKATPKPESSADVDWDEAPVKKSTKKAGVKAPLPPDDAGSSASAKTGKKKAKPDSSENEPKAAPSEPAEKTPPPSPPPAAEPAPSEKGRIYYASASIPSSEIVAFADQPPRVRQLIEAALDLAKLNLTYTFGSADPANGGMDCSGAVYYLLRQQGFADVPRDASGQYVWARKHGQFFAVISRKPGGFEFSDLQPGDLLFWNGTYDAQRDPPVTHSMIYLGLQRHRNVPVMWGSSDGRSFDGKSRWGVSVFDFTMPKTEGSYASKALFLGYARIPGLRSDSLVLGRSQ